MTLPSTTLKVYLQRIGSHQDQVHTPEANVDFYEGATMAYYTGPVPDSTAPPQERGEKLNELERLFLSANLIKECVDRQASALVGKAPNWYLKNNRTGERVEPEQFDAIYKLIQEWLDTQNERVIGQEADWGDPLIDAVTTLLVTGQSYLRLFTPRRYANSENPLDRIALHSPDVSRVEVKRDEDNLLEEYIFSDRGDVQRQYHYNPDGDRNQELLRALAENELPVPEQGDLIVETRDEDGTESTFTVYPALNGRWLIYQMKASPMIQEETKRIQNSCNLALTTLNLNVVKSGVRTRYVSNSLPPGDLVNDPDHPGEKMFVPNGKTLDGSPGAVTFLSGIPYGTREASNLTIPSVTIEDPIDPEAFKKTIQIYRELMYAHMGQSFMMAQGDGSLSGISRIQVKQDLIVATERMTRTIEAAIAGIYTSILRLLDTDGTWTDYSVVVNLRLSFGQLLPEERDTILQTYREGLLSKSTAMSLLGDVEDADSEMEIQMLEPSAQFERLMLLHQAGLLSDQTLLERSGLVEDAEAELQKVQAERSSRQAATPIAMRSLADPANQPEPVPAVPAVEPVAVA